MSETVLDQHMAVVGRIISKFVEHGLHAHNIGTRSPADFLGSDEDKQTFTSVMDWMLDEGIIRAKDISRSVDGTIAIVAAQLTAKGLDIVKRPLGQGETIEKKIEAAQTDSSLYSKIGELVGSFAGSLTKSLGSGG